MESSAEILYNFGERDRSASQIRGYCGWGLRQAELVKSSKKRSERSGADSAETIGVLRASGCCKKTFYVFPTEGDP